MKAFCPLCTDESSSFGQARAVVRFGVFFRKSDRAKVQRFRCHVCRKTYSEATYDPHFRQHKRQLNSVVASLLVSSVTQRRAAILLNVNRKTIARKLVCLGALANNYLREKNLAHPQSKIIEFDDLETFEHTKLKPLSVTLVVEHGSRRILGFRVSRMPANGPLAKLSVKKYGRRKDERPYGRNLLFTEIRPLISASATVKSDENPHYPSDVKRHFPHAIHETHKGRRGCVVGQGELKKIGFDPLFSLNHTCAMLRANISRLVRKTWSTTKRPDKLTLHIALYSVFHNENLQSETG